MYEEKNVATWRRNPSTASQAATFGKVCCGRSVVSEEILQDHSSQELEHDTDELDTKEKIHCTQVGKQRTAKCDKPQRRENYVRASVLLSSGATENERYKWGRGVRTSHTCSLDLTGPQTLTIQRISITWQLLRAAQPEPLSQNWHPHMIHIHTQVYSAGPYTIWWTQKNPSSLHLFLLLVSKMWRPVECRHHLWQGV